ncbi:Protein priB [Ceratobasidium theobromae]|uniref:Protein priB n=1 Tax=Ceratobasidium theobromae TaxID=1582974 RepID=A0A5N5Q9I4_9AGAM|nr:Protein priB [Ceratobasidium theobromae]
MKCIFLPGDSRKPRSQPSGRDVIRESIYSSRAWDAPLRQVHKPVPSSPPPNALPKEQSPTAWQQSTDRDVLEWLKLIRHDRSSALTEIAQTETAYHTHEAFRMLPVRGLVGELGDWKLPTEAYYPRAGYNEDYGEAEYANLLPESAGSSSEPSTTPNYSKRRRPVDGMNTTEGAGTWTGGRSGIPFRAGSSSGPEPRIDFFGQELPEILKHGIIKTAEVDQLFKIRRETCTVAMHFARQAATTALAQGQENIELVQAYILMSAYSVPDRRGDDRTAVYFDSAMKLAKELKLHLPWQGKTTGEPHERQILSRTRTWLICSNMHQSDSTMFGQRPMMPERDTDANRDWHRQSSFNISLDVHMTAFTRLLRIIAQFRAKFHSHSNSPASRTKDALSLCISTAEELNAFERKTKAQFDRESDHNGKRHFETIRAFYLMFKGRSRVRIQILVNYSRAVIFSFGWRQASGRSPEQDKLLFNQCYNSASEVVRIAIEVLAPSGRLKYSPDRQFAFLNLAATFLIKLLGHQFSAAREPEQSAHIINSVTRLTEVLSSTQVAIDDHHAPSIHARFLSGLINKYAAQGPAAFSKSGTVHAIQFVVYVGSASANSTPFASPIQLYLIIPPFFS